MAGPPRILPLVLFAALAGAAVRAQTTDPAPAASPGHESATSPKLASTILSTLPKYDPPKAIAAAPVVPADQPHNKIIRLPAYVVRDNRLPDPEDLLTEKGRNAAAAARYLGPETTLDRVLNHVTLNDLWKSIPVLGKIPFVPFQSMDRGERAMYLYGRIEEPRRINELLQFDAAARKLESEEAKSAPAASTSTSTTAPAKN
jgi:hypothetical protein